MQVVSVDRRTSVTHESVEVSSRIISAEILLKMSKPIWFRLFHFELAQSKQKLKNRSKDCHQRILKQLQIDNWIKTILKQGGVEVTNSLNVTSYTDAVDSLDQKR